MNITGSIQIPCIPQITGSGHEIRKYNAVIHGFWDNRVVIAALGESQADFEMLYETMSSDLNPQGLIEQDLVHRLAETCWQMKRALRYESAEVAAQIGEVNSRYGKEIAPLQEQLEKVLYEIGEWERCLSQIKALETLVNWDESEVDNNDILNLLYSQVNKDILQELRECETPQQIREMLKSKTGWQDSAIIDVFKRSREGELDKYGAKRTELEENIKRLREWNSMARDRSCIPSSDVTSKVQRFLGPLEKRYLKDLEVLLKMQAIRLGLRRVSEN